MESSQTNGPAAVLRQVRESLVRKRRAMAEQMMPEGAAVAHFGPAFVDLQAAIEAVDRALRDEEALPAGYAADGRAPELQTEAGSNVEFVDFDASR